MTTLRQYTFLDPLIIELDKGLRVIFTKARENRPNPSRDLPESSLHTQEKRHSAGLMRVNHTGEICAQALYNGQLVTAKNPRTRSMLAHAAREETDHLAWCEKRLEELGSHTSYFNGGWYWGSYAIGFLAGLAGDRWSLGFVEETEAQVGRHLEGHMNHLPRADDKSRAIVKQMAIDEAEHGDAAQKAGSQSLPAPVKCLMAAIAKLMTTTVYHA